MLEITLSSGKVVTFRDLTARQQMNADRCANGNFSQLPYFRVAATIAKIDATEFAVASNDLELDARIDLLDAAEYNQLLDVFSEAFAPKKAAVKNI